MKRLRDLETGPIIMLCSADCYFLFTRNYWIVRDKIFEKTLLSRNKVVIKLIRVKILLVCKSTISTPTSKFICTRNYSIKDGIKNLPKQELG